MTKQKKVMIADDDPGILDAVGAMLEFGGYDVRTTYDRWKGCLQNA
jgi:DNA-binding NtrC family response regulator